MRRGLVLALAVAVLGTASRRAQTLGTPIYKAPIALQAQRAGRIHLRSRRGCERCHPGRVSSCAAQDSTSASPWDTANGSGGNANLFGVGIDGRLPIARHNQDFPLDAALTAGFGALFGDGQTGFLVPLGATLGRQVLLENSSVSFTPYVAPVIAPTFGDLLDDVQFGLGLGVDIALTKTFDIRVSGSLGDYRRRRGGRGVAPLAVSRQPLAVGRSPHQNDPPGAALGGSVHVADG